MANAHKTSQHRDNTAMTYVRRGERTVLVVVPPWWALGSELSTVVPDSPLSVSLSSPIYKRLPRVHLLSRSLSVFTETNSVVATV